ncbi:MAG: cell division protein FtsZ, partial [Cellulomonas sp.]
QEAAHPEANIIFGAVIDDALGDEVRVTVIAAGFDGGAPVVRRDARGLGQVSAGGGQAAQQAPASIPPAAAVPTTTAAHAAVPPRPVGPDEERRQAAEVPAFLTPDQAGTSQLEVPRIFEEEVARRKEDDLDVPDFLK